MERPDPTRDVEPLLAEQIQYYDDRAPEHEDLWFRRGRHDLGPEFNERWFRETAIVESAVDEAAPKGSVLEIGCGSGLWTRRLAPKASRYVGLDSSPRMLDLNRQRYGAPHVEYVLADAFGWTATERFDLIFLGFFVSHIPPELWERWWGRVANWLEPDGIAFIVDDAAGPDRPYSGDAVEDGPPHAHRRRLGGGREYTIVKVFYSPEELSERLDDVGWRAELAGTGEHLLFGSARPR
jgi:demethylmenaquinone methyltransferase/2-methoxy-6-polyprenyl-1,4-benzoquinol methylase